MIYSNLLNLVVLSFSISVFLYLFFSCLLVTFFCFNSRLIIFSDLGASLMHALCYNDSVFARKLSIVSLMKRRK